MAEPHLDFLTLYLRPKVHSQSDASLRHQAREDQQWVPLLRAHTPKLPQNTPKPSYFAEL
jgi:hypothetical protein